MSTNSSELQAYNTVVQLYLKSNPNATASDIDPEQIVEFAKVNNYRLFDDSADKASYVVSGDDIVFKDKSGGFLDFNTKTGTDSTLSNSDLVDVFGGDSVSLGDDVATVTQYTFNGEKSGTIDRGNEMNKEVAVDFSTTAGQNTVTNAINSYVSSNGSPSSLRDVFGVNDSNIIFNQSGTQESMECVQNGKAYVVKYDSSTGQTSITQLTASSLGFTSGDVGATFSIANDQLTYKLDWSKINFAKSADEQDVASGISEYANTNGASNMNLKNIFGDADSQHLYSSDDKSMVYVQNNNAYFTKYDATSGDTVITEFSTDGNEYIKTYNSSGTQLSSTTQGITASNASAYGITLPTTGSLKSISFAITNGHLTDSYVMSNGTSSTSGSGSSSSYGDPHFYYNGAYAFDFQGTNTENTEGTNNADWTMLDASDINVTAKFTEDYGSNAQGSTIMTQETIKLKSSGISVIANNDGTYKITDSSGNTIDAATAAKAGASISQSGDVVTVTEGTRTISVQLSNCMNNTNITTEAGDKGILTQTEGAATNNTSDAGQYMVSGDSGSAVAAPVLIYDSDNASSLASQMISTLNNVGGISYIKTVMNEAVTGSEPTDPVAKAAYDSAQAVLNAVNSGNTSNLQSLLTTWITDSSKSMLQDINSGSGSIASRFQAGHGYSTSQWDEFFGTLEDVAGSNVVDNTDGTAKGITVNGKEDDFILNLDNIFLQNGSTTNNNWS